MVVQLIFNRDPKQNRFNFGANWRSFLETLSDERIAVAQKSLKDMLQLQDLTRKHFLDIGCGSGLFSLAAMRLGASEVLSFDYDTESVGCAKTLKQWFFPGSSNWKIMRGDVLDEQFIKSLGAFDIVLSWGVLHHTGAIWKAMDNALAPVKNDGLFFIAIYNDQEMWSRWWMKVKQIHSKLPTKLQPVYAGLFLPRLDGPTMAKNMLNGKLPWAHWSEYFQIRGMSRWHDIKDWIGGLPFEVAKPEEVFHFCKQRGFVLEQLTTCGGGKGCNQFVFRKIS
jgi:2-polyprenyl-3-methyl-5-hydroxy-6-metoxy-1,4-benzoquinol methylase